MWNPSEKEAKKAFDYASKSPDNYNKMNEMGKRAFWQYGKGKGVFNLSTLGEKAKGEYSKYVSDDMPYASDNPMERATLARRSEQGQFDVSEQVKTGKVQDRRLLNERRLEELTPITPTKKPIMEGQYDANKGNTNTIKPSGNKLVDFITATSGKAVNTIFGTDYNQIDSMGKGMDATTDVTGAILGYTAPIGEAGSLWNAAGKITNAAGKVVSKVIPKAVTNAAGKIATTKAGNVAMNIGKKALEGAPTGAILDTLQGVQRGEDKQQIMNRVGQGALIGATANVALMGLGKAGEVIIKKLINKQTLSAAEKAAIDKLPDEAKKEIILYVDTYGNVRKTPTTDLQLSAPKQNLPKVDNFNSITKTIGKPEKTILVGKPIDNVINKVSIKKIKLTPEETQLDNVIKRSGTNIDELISEAEKKAKEFEEQQFQYLKGNKAKGVEPANIIRDDTGTVTGRFGKVSNNDRWYREFYAENKRPPTNAELREMAKEQLRKGFGTNTMDIPANEEYVQAVKDLESYRNIKSANSSIQSVPLTITQKGIQPTPQLIPSTLKQKGRTLTTDKPIQSALNARLNKPQIAPGKNIESPFRLTPAEKARIEGVKQPIANQGTLTSPLAQKSITEPLVKPEGTLGKATWKNKDYDAPIEIIGDYGTVNGKKYVKIKGSDTGVPLDEIVYSAPIENKSLTGALKPPKETDKIKQAHSNIRNLKNQLDVASNPDEITALKKTLAAERKTVKEYNTAIRDERIKKVKNLIFNSDNWKDKGGYTGNLRLQRETWDRNIIDIAGKDGEAVKEAIFTPIHANEAARTRFKNVSRNTVKNLNLSVEEREIVQKVGEGVMPLTDIPKGMDAAKIQKSIDTLRNWYDEAIDKANDVLVRNGYEPIGKLPNYFPHFTGDDPVLKALGIKLDNVELPTDINGITATFRPGKQFFGNFLKRTGDKTTYDAVAGFDRYVEGISNVIYHTDDIKTLRTFIDELRLKYSSDEVIKRVNEIRNSNLPEAEMEERISDILKSGDTHLSNATADLEEYTNVLAGKKDLADRAAERWFGRPIYNAVNAISNRIGRNMTAVSPSSWLTNFIPITQSLATTSKAAVLQAFDDTMRNIVKNDGFVDKSTFLTNRVGSDILDKGIVEKTGDVLSAPFKWIDNFTSNVVTRAKYWEGINKGMDPEDAMRQADEWGAKILGDRSKGAQPTLFNQRNPITRVLTQFQLEVNNQVSFIMKDMPREYLKGGANPKNVARLSSALGQLAIYSWLYNEMYEKATGRRPAADIIGITLGLKEDLQNSNMGKSQAVLNLGKNVANTLPFSSTFTGGRIPIGTPLAAFGKGITGAYEVATGERDVKTGLAQAGKDLAKGAAYIVPPFGGSQLIKTTEGLSAVNKGGAYKTNAAGEKALQYPIANTIGNKVQAAIFGKSALGETRAFYDNMVKALSTDQTKAYEYAVNKGIQPKVVYDQILTLRKLMPEQGHKEVTDSQRIKSIRLNQNLTEEQKRLIIQLFVQTEQGKKLIEKK
jgi:hypothetical protein